MQEFVAPTARGNTKLTSADIESLMWQSLGLDSLTGDIDAGKSSPVSSVMMGTGMTHGACNGCGPSDTSQGNCTPRPLTFY